MASNKSVIVLAPNGRRQNVKVTPNTTILQILEEVCKKQGFKSDEYDLKHHNNVLDTTAIIRFSGLPNNAQLEMCAAQKVRKDTPVILGLQLENGTRLTGDFTADNNLWEVLKQLCPEESSSELNLVVIYMRREVYGMETLKNTSLRSLGITGGRAMLRLIHKTPEELKTQANVSAPLPSKPAEEKPYYRKPKDKSPKRSVEINSNEPKADKSEMETSVPSQPKEKTNFISDFIKKEKTKKSPTRERKFSQEEPMEVDTVETPTAKEKAKKLQKYAEDIKLEDLVFLGERNAMIFSLEMAQIIPQEDLPDEFFELTIQDAQRLFHDLKKKREELEESPLQTSAIRNLEQSKKVLRNLHHYKNTVIRVQFPDRTILQGTFKPFETVEHVINFVSGYLQDSSLKFHLYTTPPKSILEPTSTLVESDCVPCALVHFGTQTATFDKFLRQDLYTKLVSPSIASIAASKLMVKIHQKEMEESQMKSVNSDDNDVNVGASTSKAISAPLSPKDEPKSKVPKWFKSTK